MPDLNTYSERNGQILATPQLYFLKDFYIVLDDAYAAQRKQAYVEFVVINVNGTPLHLWGDTFYGHGMISHDPFKDLITPDGSSTYGVQVWWQSRGELFYYGWADPTP